MTFRATLHEIARLLGVSDTERLEKSGCRGVAVHLSQLQPGQLFFDFYGEAHRAFELGASIIITEKGVALSEEAVGYAIMLDDVASAFWILFRWWKKEMSAPVGVVVGEDSEVAWFEQVAACVLLSSEKGCFRTIRDIELLETEEERERILAAQVLNSEEGSLWYLVGMEPPMKTLLRELNPDVCVVSRDSRDSVSFARHAEKFIIALESDTLEEKKAETFAYLERGRLAYVSGDFSVSEWPVPSLHLVRSLRYLPLLGEKLGVAVSEDAIARLGKRFFAPPRLGFHIGLGEVGDLWVERACLPSMENLEALSANAEDVTLGVIVDSTRALEGLSESASSPAIGQTRWFFLGNALPASVSLQSEMQILCAKNIDDVVVQLAETPVFFLIAYLKNEKLADELFQKRDELYTLANYNPNEDESN